MSEVVTVSLRGRKLPSWSPIAAAGVAIGLTAALAAAGAVSGRGQVTVLAVVLFLFLHSAASMLVEGQRQAKNRLFTTGVYAAFLLAIIPLGLIIGQVIAQGAGALSPTFITHSMFRINPDTAGGGLYHAIVGTLEQGLLAGAIATPIGVLAAIYLVEYGKRNSLARMVSFFVDIMVGIPSIVAGLFVYTFWILVLGFQKSGFAGALALFIIMLPLVIRSTEEMLKLVAHELRESSYALGIPQWKTIVKVVLPTAMGGIVTGVMLGLARVMGETAPLLLLVGSNSKINFNPFSFGSTQNPQMSLPTFINEQFQNASGSSAAPAYDRAWGAALVLIIIVMVLNGIARLVARLFRANG
ncbi:MAG TPA: phosphate ABC transporter permease PstA [Mycobacteriales bacterium]|nr:phosphate ABC transporter permease PstA [Mycobacteriales bacterium]